MKKPFLYILLLGFISCIERKPIITGHEGQSLPSFNLLLPDSSTYFNTASIPEGQPVVLFYISPRCPYCRAQMEDIVDNIESMKDVQFYVFTPYPFREMKGFYKHYGLDKYPNISMGRDYTNFFGKYFETTIAPYTAIYKKDKTLKNAFKGKINTKQIIKTVVN